MKQVIILGGEGGGRKLQILLSKKTTKRGGGGQKSPILKRHSLWTAPNLRLCFIKRPHRRALLEGLLGLTCKYDNDK